MTWSQMQLFSRAARIKALEEYQMQLSIAHNPYRKNPERLHMAIRGALSRLRAGSKKPVVSVAHLEAMFGKAKRVQVSREELLAKAKPRKGTFKRGAQ